MKALLISSLLFTLFIITSSFKKPKSKKDILLDISKLYFYDNYKVLNEIKDENLYNAIIKSDSLRNYIFDLPTIIHEANHIYSYNRREKTQLKTYYFRLNDTLSFNTDYFSTLPCEEIDKSIPKNIKTLLPRYNTYISTDSKNLQIMGVDIQTQSSLGFFMLFEEFCCYYQGLKTQIGLYKYVEDNYPKKDHKMRAKFLSTSSSYRYCLKEFNVFLFYYLEHCKTHNVELYNSILNCVDFKKVYKFINDEQSTLNKKYWQYRNKILSDYKKQIRINKGYLYVEGEAVSYSLQDKENSKIDSLAKNIIVEWQN